MSAIADRLTNVRHVLKHLRLPLPLWFGSRKDTEVLTGRLAQAAPELPLELKLGVVELLRDLRREHRGAFGFLLVLGWDRKWNRRYASIADATQNLYREEHPAIMEQRAKVLRDFVRIAHFDGAVLVNKTGKAVASGVYLENMCPGDLAQEIGKQNAPDLSVALGFSHKVHTRHLAGIACSYRLKGTLVYVISEEDRSFRIFHNGRILWSPYRRELAEL